MSNTESDATKNITIMRKGDYSVHILVEEVQGIEQKIIDKLPKPVVKLTCFGESKRTSAVKNGCISYTFDEHFYFEKSNLSAKQLDCSKILIESTMYFIRVSFFSSIILFRKRSRLFSYLL